MNINSAKNFKPERHKKRVAIIDRHGNILREFDSIKEASTQTGVCQSSISMVCGGINTFAGGYRWKKL